MSVGWRALKGFISKWYVLSFSLKARCLFNLVFSNSNSTRQMLGLSIFLMEVWLNSTAPGPSLQWHLLWLIPMTGADGSNLLRCAVGVAGSHKPRQLVTWHLYSWKGLHWMLMLRGWKSLLIIKYIASNVLFLGWNQHKKNEEAPGERTWMEVESWRPKKTKSWNFGKKFQTNTRRWIQSYVRSGLNSTPIISIGDKLINPSP